MRWNYHTFSLSQQNDWESEWLLKHHWVYWRFIFDKYAFHYDINTNIFCYKLNIFEINFLLKYNIKFLLFFLTGPIIKLSIEGPRRQDLMVAWDKDESNTVNIYVGHNNIDKVGTLNHSSRNCKQVSAAVRNIFALKLNWWNQSF